MVGAMQSKTAKQSASTMPFGSLPYKLEATGFAETTTIDMAAHLPLTATWLLLEEEMAEVDGEMQSMKQVTKAVRLMPLQEP